MIYAEFKIKDDDSNYYLECLNNGKINLKIDGEIKNSIRSKLVDIIKRLNLDIEIYHKNGDMKNTQTLGKKIILNLDYNEEVLEERDIKSTKNDIKVELKLVEKGEINLKGVFNWNRIIINKNEYKFEHDFRLKNHKNYIYRWFIYKENETNKCYIGETINLFKRINQYKKPGKKQKTNIRIYESFKELIDDGYTIHLELLNLQHVILDESSTGDVNLKEFRRLFENYFIIKAKKDGYDLLNK